MTAPTISVLVRARNEAPAIGRCLELVARQRLAGAQLELIVVDHASTDATREIATGHGVAVLSIGADEFSFGRALNLAAVQARGEVLVALSAHAFPRDDGWLARLVAALEDPSVACASGEHLRPDGSPMTGPISYDGVLAATHPEWGYSNAAGAFRASLWRERGFREDLPGCEDKEWCHYWVSRGYRCVLDPALVVDHDHTHDPVRAIYRRAAREAAGLAAFVDRPPPTPRGLITEWLNDTRYYDSPWRARLSHRRAAWLLGAYAGQGGGWRPNGTRSTRLRAWISRR